MVGWGEDDAKLDAYKKFLSLRKKPALDCDFKSDYYLDF